MEFEGFVWNHMLGYTDNIVHGCIRWTKKSLLQIFCLYWHFSLSWPVLQHESLNFAMRWSFLLFPYLRTYKKTSFLARWSVLIALRQCISMKIISVSQCAGSTDFSSLKTTEWFLLRPNSCGMLKTPVADVQGRCPVWPGRKPRTLNVTTERERERERERESRKVLFLLFYTLHVR